MKENEVGKHAAVLLEVALQFGVTLELDRLLSLVLHRVTDLLQAERALFALCDEQGRTERAVLHNLEWPGPGAPLPVSNGLIRDVIAQKQPIVVPDAERNDSYSSRPSVQELGIRFMVGVPVPLGDAIIGVLYVDSRAEYLEDISDRIDLLRAIGRLVGTAVENARLFEEQRYRARLLASMVHDFRTPLQVVDMNVRLLTPLAQKLGSGAPEMIRDIAACSRRLARMASTTLALSRMEAEAELQKTESFNIASAVEEHVRLLHIVAQAVGVSIDVKVSGPMPRVSTSGDHLWIVLDNLIFNALKHARAASPITVSLALRPDLGPATAIEQAHRRPRYLFRRAHRIKPKPGTEFVQISVHNTGSHIREDRLDQIFSEFVRGEDAASDRESTGLGLSIVEQCVNQLGGTVWCDSDPTNGTSFHFTLPCLIE